MSRMVYGLGALIAVLLLTVAATAHAQVDRATLTGIVRDPSDAVIGKATVKVTSLATNSVQTVSTTADGTYLVVNLAAGDYLVQVEAPGFQRFEQTGIAGAWRTFSAQRVPGRQIHRGRRDGPRA